MPDQPLSAPPDLAQINEVRAAVAEAAGLSSGLWLSYLFVLFYLVIAAAGVTHRDLFLENLVRLPFLGVELPLIGFFALGPLIFLVVHAYVLLHVVLLGEKARLLQLQLRLETDAERERELLPVNIFVQLLAGPRARSWVVRELIVLIVWISLVIGPVALLVFFELQFLPYHSELISWWHRVAVVVDLALLWTLWPLITGGPDGLHTPSRLRTGAKLVATALPVFLVFMIATFPGEALERAFAHVPLRQTLVAGEVDAATLRPTSWFSNRLVLPALDLLDHDKIDTLAKLAVSPVRYSLRGRNLTNAVLTDATLPRMDFSWADLRGASFLRARAQGTWFDHAELSGAVLDQASLQGASFYGARMLGASLDGAALQGGQLAAAQLKGAWLGGAVLDAASLASADLRGAILDGAQLRGANLFGARLQGASLRGATLRGASFERAFMARTDFRDVTLPAAPGLRVGSGPGSAEPSCNTDADDPCRSEDTADKVASITSRYFADQKNVARRLGQLQTLKQPVAEWEQQSQTRLAALQALHWNDSDDSVTALWRELACTGSGAPFVVQTLIGTIDDTNAFTAPRAPRVVNALVKHLLSDACTARPAIDEATRMRLLDLMESRALPPGGDIQPAQSPANSR